MLTSLEVESFHMPAAPLPHTHKHTSQLSRAVRRSEPGKRKARSMAWPCFSWLFLELLKLQVDTFSLLSPHPPSVRMVLLSTQLPNQT